MSRILVIEDSPTQAQNLAITLEAAGFQVDTADCLAAGLERLARDGINAVLLDLTLPDSDGLQTFYRDGPPPRPPSGPGRHPHRSGRCQARAKAVEAGARHTWSRAR